MLFLFSLPDCETEAYVTHDPMFKEISGVHLNLDFISDGMVKKMTEQLQKTDPAFKGLDLCMSEFMYSYAKCMRKTLKNGLKPDGTALVHHSF